LSFAFLENEGVRSLIPDGRVNRSLTHISLGSFNSRTYHLDERVEIVVALVSRCTNLDGILVERQILHCDQHHGRRLDLLLDRKRLCAEASALAGSPFSVLFPFVEKAHRHEHGFSAILVILQNDGDDHFSNANNRAIE
jgi:hypothetical protein